MTFKTWFSLGLLMSAAAVNAADWNNKVSFSATASRASRLFPDLSKAIGIPLLTSPQTENEVLQIQVRDVPIRELMDHIAQAASASWKKERDSYRLIRTVQASRKLEFKEADDRLVMFEAFIRQLNKENSGLPVWTSAFGESLAKKYSASIAEYDPTQPMTREIQTEARKLRQQSPADRAIRSLLNEIGAKRLASLLPSKRTVFALHPTRMQLPLSGNADKIIQEFVGCQGEFAEAFSRTNAGLPTRVTFELGLLPEIEPGNPTLGIGQAFLVVNQGSARSVRPGIAMTVTLVVADTSGATLATGEITLFSIAPSKPILKEADNSTPITLSPLAQEFARALGRSGGGMNLDEFPSIQSQIEGVKGTVVFYRKAGGTVPRKEVSQELRTLLLSPEIHDPFGITVGEAIRSASSILGVNLVADLPDSAFFSLMQNLQGSQKAVDSSHFLYKEIPQAGINVLNQKGWITMLPELPYQSQTHRADRDALGTLARAIDSKQVVTLHDLSAFALTQEKEVTDLDPDGVTLNLSNGTLGRAAIVALRNPNILRIYGSLTDLEKASMESSGSLSIESLTANQKKWLTEDTFNSFDGPRKAVELDGSENPASSFSSSRRFSGPLTGSLDTERTQLLPDGIPDSGKLVFNFESEDGFVAKSTADGASKFVTTRDLAARLFQKEKPALGIPIQFDFFTPAKHVQLKFDFKFKSDVSLARTLEDQSVRTGAKSVAFDDLPASDKLEVREILDKIRNSSLAKMQIGSPSPRRRVPPPR